MNTKLHYRGPVKVILEGTGALEPTASPPGGTNEMRYYVANPQSTILVRDFRRNPVRTAQRILEGKRVNGFARHFSQPAWAEITSTNRWVEIRLHDQASNGDDPATLWLGVTDSDWGAPLRLAEWEFLKPVGAGRVAFAALVD